jgi:hypothetical protein
MRQAWALAVVAVLAVLAGGCGGDSSDQEASKAISDQIMAQQKSDAQTSQFFTMDRKDANCIGDGLVDKIGTDQLRQYGVLTKQNKANKDVTGVKMSTKDAKAATDVLFVCTDVESMMQKAMANSGQVPDTMKACMNKVLTEGNLRTMFQKVFEGSPEEAQQALITPLMKCTTGS